LTLYYKLLLFTINRPQLPIAISISTTMAQLTHARYGKDNIRLYKVHRDQATGTQSVAEMTVGILLEGDIATS
jgi:urate oxidase